MRTLLITNNQKTLVLEVLTDAINNTQENVTIHDIKVIRGELRGAVESGLDINIPNVISLTQFKALINLIGLNLEIIDHNTLVTIPLVDNSADVFDFIEDKGGALDDGVVGEEYDYTFVTDYEIGNVVFSHTGNLPTGLSLSKGGVLSGELTEASEEFEFTIIATDNTGQVTSYVFTIEVLPNTATDILTYSIPTAYDVKIDDTNHTVEMMVPFGTDVSKLTPTFTVSEGATASPESGVEDDFTSEVTVTVTAGDGTTTQDWTVIVTITPASTETDILTYSIPTAYEVKIDGLEFIVKMMVPFGTDVSALTPTFTVSEGATASPESGVEDDFRNPVTVTVTAEDGETTQDWTVTVTIANE